MPPDDLPTVASLGEEWGFDEVLVGEDVPFTAGISAATACVASTKSIRVDLAIVSALLRQPAILAMEMATLSRMYPDRDLICGIGLGVPEWLRQMNILPKSPMRVMRECVESVQALLRGEEINFAGEYFHFEHMKLVHPPHKKLPIYMGVVGPKLLQLSGELCDGTFLSVDASPQYVSWARQQIETGAIKGGKDSDQHQICTLALFAIDSDGRRAREQVRYTTAWWMAAMGANALTTAYGIGDHVQDMIDRSGPTVDEQAATIAREMPESWLNDLVVAGNPDECAETIHRFWDSGSNSIVLFPCPVNQSESVFRMAAKELLPLLR